MLETQRMVIARLLARAKAGKSIAARIAMMAMTTRSSIRVNASGLFVFMRRRQFFVARMDCTLRKSVWMVDWSGELMALSARVEPSTHLVKATWPSAKEKFAPRCQSPGMFSQTLIGPCQRLAEHSWTLASRREFF